MAEIFTPTDFERFYPANNTADTGLYLCAQALGVYGIIDETNIHLIKLLSQGLPCNKISNILGITDAVNSHNRRVIYSALKITETNTRKILPNLLRRGVIQVTHDQSSLFPVPNKPLLPGELGIEIATNLPLLADRLNISLHVAQILERFMQGHASKAIADEFSVTDGTIRNTVSLNINTAGIVTTDTALAWSLINGITTVTKPQQESQ